MNKNIIQDFWIYYEYTQCKKSSKKKTITYHVYYSHPQYLPPISNFLYYLKNFIILVDIIFFVIIINTTAFIILSRISIINIIIISLLQLLCSIPCIHWLCLKLYLWFILFTVLSFFFESTLYLAIQIFCNSESHLFLFLLLE